MQTTLLGLAIALILALLAALVGPYFIDWTQYRPRFEAEASRLIGMPVRVGGAIDVRLLPTPSLLLNRVEIGPRGEDALRARSLGIELALGPLLRGQLRASQTRIAAPELTVTLTADGRASLPSGGVDIGDFAVDQLQVEDARVHVVHAASGRRFTFEKLWFNGEVRSLAGSFRGEGAFLSGQDLYGYRVSAARQDSGAIRLRFNLDPSERGLNAEGDGAIITENNVAKFEGGVTLTRPVGTVLADGRAVVNEPLRLTARVKASAASALLEQIEFQYGPEERALKLSGTAELKFGERPRLDGILSATTLDIDRLSAASGQLQRAPLAALRALAESFGGGWTPPLPMKIGFSADTVTLAGAPVQSLRGDLTANSDGLVFDSVQFRAPGFTDVTFSGKAALAPSGLAFSGPADIASTDPRLLIRWLDGRSDVVADGPAKPVKLRADVSLGGDRIALERLRAEVDRKTIDGRLVYLWAAGDRKARLEAALTAPELDLDGLIDAAQAALGGTKLDKPGEVALALDIGRATIAGIEARRVNAKLTVNPDGLTVERLNLGEFGGASLDAKGRISMTDAAPRGHLSVDLDARDLSGVSALLGKFAPGKAEAARRALERIGATRLRGTLDVEDAPEKGRSVARLALSSQSGGLRIALKGDATGDHKAIMKSTLRLDASADADDGAQLFRLASLDRVAAGTKGAGRFVLQAQGPLDGDIKVDGRMAVVDGFDGRAQGTLRLSNDLTASGQFNLSVGGADLSWLRTTPGAPVTAALTARVTMDGRQLKFENAMASIEGTSLRGKFDLDLNAAPRITGQIDTDAIDAGAVVGSLAGMPGRGADGWSAEPFASGYFGAVTGRLGISAARANFGRYVAKDFRAALRLDPAEFSADAIEGEVADGKVSGDVLLRRAAEGLSLKARIALKNADASAALPLENNPFRGRLGLQFDVEGLGLSPKALIGSLAGNGTVSLERANVAGLDPRVFPTVMRAADRGLPLDPARIRDSVTPWLDAGALEIAHADGVITIAGGQVRLPTLIARAKAADVSASGNLDLVNASLDARVALTGTANVASSRPEIIVQLRGPFTAPKRNIDVAALAGWLALRAVDQQSKTLEAIEQGRGVARETPPSPPDSEIIPDTPAPERSIVLPRPRARATEPAPAAPVPAPTPNVAPAQKPAAFERAAPLPPPLDIRPAPGVRQSAPPTRPQAITPPAERNTF